MDLPHHIPFNNTLDSILMLNDDYNKRRQVFLNHEKMPNANQAHLKKVKESLLVTSSALTELNKLIHLSSWQMAVAEIQRLRECKRWIIYLNLEDSIKTPGIIELDVWKKL